MSEGSGKPRRAEPVEPPPPPANPTDRYIDKVQSMADELYPDPEVKAVVMEDVRAKGTAKKIAKGELRLPHPWDAKLHFERLQAQKRSHDEEDE